MATPLVVVHDATDADQQSNGDSCYDDLCRTLGLSAAPPYWFLFIGMAVTPLIHVSLFGPMRLRSSKTLGTFTTGLLYWTIISFGLTMLLDAIALIEVAKSGLGFGQRLSAVFMIISFSPNTSAGIALSAVGSVYEQAKLWRQDYGRGGLDWPTFDEAMAQKGPLYAYYRKMAHWAGAIPGALAFTYCIPAFCAYCWIFISIGSCLLCLSWVACPLLIRVLLGRATKKKPEEAEAGLDTERKDADDSGEEGDNEPFISDEPEVLVDWNVFILSTGAPRQSWAQFCFALLMIFLLAQICPMAARLYSGAGYWNAVWWTLLERGLGGPWLASLFNGDGGLASLGRAFLAINWLS